MKEQKNIETCLTESVLAEVSSVSTAPPDPEPSNKEE